VHHYPTKVTHNLEPDTEDHSDEKSPCSPADGEPDLKQEKKGEDGQVERVAWKVRNVLELTLSPGPDWTDGVITLDMSVIASKDNWEIMERTYRLGIRSAIELFTTSMKKPKQLLLEFQHANSSFTQG
jgi:hypothetical protein